MSKTNIITKFNPFLDPDSVKILKLFERIESLTAVEDDVDWALTQLEHYVDGYHRGNQIQVN